MQQLRRLAKSGATVPDLVLHIRDTLNEGDNIGLYVVVYLCETFDLRISEAKPVCAWSFFSGGTWTGEQVNAEIQPLIRQRQENWDVLD